MITVILTIHVLIVLALIGVVLLQRSEGGALGMGGGGGGGGGGFMTGRGAANALTRTTSILAALFFSTSLALAIFADSGESDASVIEDLTRGAGGASAPAETEPGAAPTTDELMRSLGAGEDDGAEIPAAPDAGADTDTPDMTATETAPAPSDEPAAGQPAPDGEPQPNP